MKIIQVSIAIFILCFFSGCKPKSNHSKEKQYHAEKLAIDNRYSSAIDFEPLNITIPLKDKNTFIRIDKPVSDMDTHQKTILNELSIPLDKCRFHYSNEAEHGRTITLYFGDGKKCSFIWVLENDSRLLLDACLNHEKYHALCKLAPESVSTLNSHIRTLGFSINLKDYDEELAATIIQILSINRSGIDLEEISGSGFVVQAVEILKKSQIP
jgi:hypothetical protein